MVGPNPIILVWPILPCDKGNLYKDMFFIQNRYLRATYSLTELIIPARSALFGTNEAKRFSIVSRGHDIRRMPVHIRGHHLYLF
jgi:hypothetical protein